MAEYVVAQAAVLIVPTLGKGTNSFDKKLDAELARIRKQVEVEATLDAKKLQGQFLAQKAWLESQDININAKINPKQLTEIRHKYEDLSREFKKGLMLDLKVTGLNLLPQVSYGLAAVNASIVQLGQSALILPGLFAGMLSSVGALATGLSGVKAAFKEYSDEQKNSAQTALQARNAATNVENAYRDLGRAFKDAQRNLEDLNAQLRDAPLDEADAIIRVQEAIAEANDRAGKSGLQQQKDALALIKAENGLADVRLRNSRLVQDVAEANAKGVKDADNVRDATDRLSKAQDVAATQTQKLSDSFSKLSPNTQSFGKALEGLSSQWGAFKSATQDRLFAGLDQEITGLAQTSLPMLQKGFVAIADSLNGNVKAAFKSLESPAQAGFIERILGNTAEAQGNLDGIFDPLTDGFLRLSAVGSDLLPRLANGLTDLLQRFDSFVVRAEGNGSLEKWMNQGIDALKDLGNSIINVGSIMNSLSEAFTGSGGNGLLPTLENATSRMAEFLKSAEGQQKLTEFFTTARDELAQWRPVLDEIPGLLENVAAAGKQWADILLPFLTTAGRTLAAHPALVQAVFTAFLLWKNVSPVIHGVKTSIDAVTKVMEYLHVNVMAGAQGHIGKYAAAMDTAKTKVGNLAGAIMSGGGLVAAATLAVTWMGTNLVRAHDDAAAAARRQETDLSQLKNTLDGVTGSATNATNALVAKNLYAGENASTGKSDPRAFKTAVPDEAQRHQIAMDIAAGKLDSAIAGVPGATAADIEALDLWRYQDAQAGPSYREFGLTSQDLADAVNGKPEAVSRYEDWVKEVNRIPGLSDEASAAIANATNVKPTDLLSVQNALPEKARAGSIVQNEIYAGVNDLATSQQNTRDINVTTFGRAAISPSSQLAQYGIVGDPGFSADGGSLVTSSAPPDGSAEADEMRKRGITFTPNGLGQFNVSLDKQAATENLVKYASGGLISGPGTGTSDSILARLSHGEYVVNAASTQKHLPMLENINSGNLPGFSGGGEIIYPAPGLPDVPTKGTFTLPPIGLPTPSAGNRPGDFNRSSFKTAGEGQAARRGLDTKAIAATNNAEMQQSGGSVNRALGKVGDFFNASMGLYNITGSAPPDGYKETSTATVSTDRPEQKPKLGPVYAYTGTFGGTPLPPKAPAPKTPAGAPPPGGAGKPPISVTPTVPATSVPGASAAPKPAEVGYTGPQQHITGAKPGPIDPVQALPSILATPVVGPAMAANLTPYAGLAVGSSVNYGQGGFPDWVYQTGQRFGMSASTYAGHQEGGGTNKGIDWAPTDVAWNTPEGAQRMTEYAKYLASLGTMEQVIYQNPFTGETVGIADGKPVGPGTDQPQYYAANWAGHQDHVHTRTSSAIPVPEQLAAMGFSSPSNMPMALTPTGIQLPQLTYGAGATTGAAGANQNDPQAMAGNYVKYVTEAWQSTLQNLVKNAGQIALKFLGSFIGIDLSGLAGIGQSAANDIGGGLDDLMGKGGDKGNGSGSNQPANADVASILESAEFKALPPSVQAAYLQQMGVTQQSLNSGVQYNPKGGAEQWRPVVRQALTQVAGKYGITNVKAWEDALIKQIQSESGGNPNIDNLNDSDGKGGTQQVFGLGQFHPDTFKSHNVTGGDIHDPVAQIYAMIDYVSSRYGMDSSGGPNWIGRGQGYASGGSIMGAGNGTSDSILARVSNGEYIVKAASAQKHMGLLNAINSNKVPGFADGMMWPVGAPAPVTPPPVTTPTPPPAPLPPDPNGPAADAQAGVPVAPTPVTETQGAGDPASTALSDVGSALGGIGDALTGAEAPAGADPTGDPRAVMGAAPQNMDHNKPAVSQGIQAAAGAISGAINTAIQAGTMAGTAGAGGPAAGAASGLVSGLVGAGGSAVAGAVNILSSLGVGTLTPSSSTAGAYGAPLTPEAMGQQPYAGPSVVNNWNGGVHTSNNEEFFKQQQRKELQNASPYLPQR